LGQAKNEEPIRLKDKKQDLFRRKRQQHSKLKQGLQRIHMYLKTLGYKYSAPTGNFLNGVPFSLRRGRNYQ